MDYLLVSSVSLLVAALTLISGFGLGTLLLPAFAAFFPIEVAIAATAVVHMANGAFKAALVGRWASRFVVLRFGIPAILAAFAGAALLGLVASLPSLAEYELGRFRARVTPVKLTIAVLLAGLAVFELRSPSAAPAPDEARATVGGRTHGNRTLSRRLALGGLLSGFLGGISGMQGAVRSAFLIRARLTRDEYVGTAAIISVMVDAARLVVYAAGLGGALGTAQFAHLREHSARASGLIIAAILAAFVGSFFGARLVRKVTIDAVRRLVGVLLILSAALLATGIL